MGRGMSGNQKAHGALEQGLDRGRRRAEIVSPYCNGNAGSRSAARARAMARSR